MEIFWVPPVKLNVDFLLEKSNRCKFQPPDQTEDNRLKEDWSLLAGAGKIKLKLFRMRLPAFFSD